MIIHKKIFRRLSSYYNRMNFNYLQKNINEFTLNSNNEILKWSEEKLYVSNIEKLCSMSEDPIVKKGYKLRNELLERYRNKYSSVNLKILIHVPSKNSSPAGYSIFTNLQESLKYIGIDSDVLNFEDSIEKKLNEFKANVFITSDYSAYTSKIDWKFISEYRKKNELKIGLTASLEIDDNSPLIPRLKWAKKNKIDFFYSFRSAEYLKNRLDYIPYYKNGFEIISIEFGANPLIYFPIPDIEKNLDYIFLGSSNSEKQNRYCEYFAPILKKYRGFICGTGWKNFKKWPNVEANKFLFAKAKIGINLHLNQQLEYESELNERTYILAACGIPQLTDNPKLLDKRFNADSMYIANSAKDYFELFEYMLNNPEECQKKALNAMSEVYEKHTTFHRAEQFILDLNKINKG